MRNFEADDETLEELDKLREFYGLQTAAATIRRALAIAVMLKDYSDADGALTIVNPGAEGQYTVKLNQRYKYQRS